MEVPPARRSRFAMRWIVQYADTRKGMPMAQALAAEIKDAASGQGNAIKKREDTHKMAKRTARLPISAGKRLCTAT